MKVLHYSSSGNGKCNKCGFILLYDESLFGDKPHVFTWKLSTWQDPKDEVFENQKMVNCLDPLARIVEVQES